MRISDWISDVCSSDLLNKPFAKTITDQVATTRLYRNWAVPGLNDPSYPALNAGMYILGGLASSRLDNLLVRKEQLAVAVTAYLMPFQHASMVQRSAEHTSELQSLMRSSYAVFGLANNTNPTISITYTVIMT